MSAPLTHADIETEGLIERYVSRRLQGEALERFEAHLIECAACQAEVRLGVAVGATFRRKRRPAWQWAAVAGLGVAAALLLFLRPLASRGLTTLGTVGDPPPYEVIEVRGPDLQRGDSLFLSAVEAYHRREWPAAMRGFDAARKAGIDAPALDFLRGVTALMQGEAELADRTFTELLASGYGPYAEEARYYQAKARLLLGDGPGALSLLRASTYPAAGPLADSIEALLSR